jgi:hypothetical protein
VITDKAYSAAWLLDTFRRVATRYDKLDPHDLAFVQIASIMVWLRTFGDTA